MPTVHALPCFNSDPQEFPGQPLTSGAFCVLSQIWLLVPYGESTYFLL